MNSPRKIRHLVMCLMNDLNFTTCPLLLVCVFVSKTQKQQTDNHKFAHQEQITRSAKKDRQQTESQTDIPNYKPNSDTQFLLMRCLYSSKYTHLTFLFKISQTKQKRQETMLPCLSQQSEPYTWSDSQTF